MSAGGRSRQALSTGLAVVAAVALLGAAVVGYVADAAFDSDEFADRATAALVDDAVRAEIARLVTDDVVLSAERDLVSVRPVIESAVDGIVGGGAFQGIFRRAVADVHRALIEGDANTVTLTLADVGAVIRGALQALAPEAASRIGGGLDADVTEVDPPAWIADVVQAAEDIGRLEVFLAVLGVGLAALAVWWAPDRRLVALRFGVAIAIGGVAVAVALGVAKSLLLVGIDAGEGRDAADGIWNAFLGDLRTGMLVFAACGVVVAAAASSLLRPVDIAAPLRRAWELIATVPATPRMRAVRAVALIAVGALIVVRHEAAVELAAILIGLYVAYAGVSELMRLTIAPADAAARAAIAGRGRRTLAVAAIAAALIVVAGGAFAATGGTDEEPDAVETAGCNGSPDLCDRRLDEIAIPATHNSMSAVTYPDWLFAQQDAGISDQLRDGIRGLLIDAHWGQPTEGGPVKTDLSHLDAGERAAYEAALGSDALDAALRIRDRIVNSPATGPRGVYLCHRFCELGAIPITQAFGDLREFLAANPDEVVVVVIEDYVEPQAIADAVEQTGLIDFLFSGPVAPSLPTPQEMIDSGGRVLMLAENDAGGGTIPWYHPAYESLTQETPYSFHKPAELTDPKQIPASCEPNRGPASAPLFLVNHWIDTSPAPRPSNAAKVNAREALLRRVRECERIRDLEADLIAVDFYREGDLFGAVAKLNGERAADQSP